MAQLDRQAGLVGNAAQKHPCRAATTANITLSGEQTIDGVACVADDRVLVKDQTTGADNGIYVVSTGTWERADDWDGSYDIVCGTFIYVHSGTVNASTNWRVTTADPITIGTTAVTIAAAFGSLDVPGDIHSATAKTPVVDADELGIVDSAASWVLKKITLTTLWTWITTHLSTAAGAIVATTGTFSGAVSGTTITGSGIVRGNTTTGTTTSSAVVGVATTSGGGVYGSSDSGTGVRGLSVSNDGVLGNSTSGTGVNGVSTSSHGVYGLSSTGRGVYGASTSNYGVYGLSGSSYGVVAESDTSSPVAAAFRMVPQDTQPSGANAIGDMWVSTSGRLYICTAAGTPGTWGAVGAQTSS